MQIIKKIIYHIYKNHKKNENIKTPNKGVFVKKMKNKGQGSLFIVLMI